MKNFNIFEGGLVNFNVNCLQVYVGLYVYLACGLGGLNQAGAFFSLRAGSREERWPEWWMASVSRPWDFNWDVHRPRTFGGLRLQRPRSCQGCLQHFAGAPRVMCTTSHNKPEWIALCTLEMMWSLCSVHASSLYLNHVTVPSAIHGLIGGAHGHRTLRRWKQIANVPGHETGQPLHQQAPLLWELYGVESTVKKHSIS